MTKLNDLYKGRTTLALLMIVAIWVLSPKQAHAVTQTKDYQSGKASFDLNVNNKNIPYELFFQTIMPGQTLQMSSNRKELVSRVELGKGWQDLNWRNGLLEWKAPKTPGLYRIETMDKDSDQKITLSVFVLRPASEMKNGVLNGYKIGNYPKPLKGLDAYAAPEGFIEVTPKNKSTRITPHFTLEQFLCKQAGGYPKYVVLKQNLLENLENLLTDVNRKGIRADSFVIMSGYRTPAYNKAIGNVANSRHIYGDASDIYIDSRKSGIMDDINGDGKINKDDAHYLYSVANNHAIHDHRDDLVGGIGVYKANAVHGPFVHVDVRGTRARWGI
ncbi:D-Ala-D-Ala carboxypeptidase family metallohydrolase [Kangiella sediminilitoris]|uniref:Peptidase M15A n=1 Tax=Kangiella sediminilitoris TaxID=1144748 RepID=A0A1B3B7M6_9GAMM|nr:D-Ala-D-Ala carboxypeptidase family metallohydrolase [Kangiella sediminilitoris]AOE48787.1 Peptidase M15A [Kangiella sediminilitoris]